MTAISVANTDWTLVDSVKTALTAATIGGSAVFETVSVTTADAQAVQCQFRGSPVAILRYVTTREDAGPEDVRGCRAEMELILAARANPATPDESSRLEEVLRLKNAAVNAVEVAAPAVAAAWGDGDHYHRRIRWGNPQIDTSVDRPWVVCRLPVEIGFVLAGPSAH